MDKDAAVEMAQAMMAMVTAAEAVTDGLATSNPEQAGQATSNRVRRQDPMRASDSVHQT